MIPCGNDCVVISLKNNYHLPISIIGLAQNLLLNGFIINYV